MKGCLVVSVLVIALSILCAGQIGIYQHGTIIRMQMGECLSARGFMATISGTPKQQADDGCPEYTLVTEKVVYVIVGRNSNQLLPLAEVTDFRFQKNEIAIRVDDARHESRFLIREMALRSDWERQRQREERQEGGSSVAHYTGTAFSNGGHR
jgi:hypothetical protein